VCRRDIKSPALQRRGLPHALQPGTAGHPAKGGQLQHASRGQRQQRAQAEQQLGNGLKSLHEHVEAISGVPEGEFLNEIAWSPYGCFIFCY
jgi:hypothetical protein